MARKKKAGSEELFREWWKRAGKRVLKIEKAWIKKKPPNVDEEGGGDYWHVNRMMHGGDAYDTVVEIAERVFMMGQRGEFWEMGVSDSLFCELDGVIEDAYLAGKEMVS